MKTLIILTALASIAFAGPTYFGKDSFDQDSRLNGVLKTVKRERKSTIPESPTDVSLDVHSNVETLPGSNVRASSAVKTGSGFRKPIIVKKKFGYHIYRDSDEELSQAEPRENCRRQFRFKLCDEDSDQTLNSLRNIQTEGVDETDVEQSLRMAKEAVESLQRDLEKIERNTKLTQKKISDENLEEKLHADAKELRQPDEHLDENISKQDTAQWKSKVEAAMSNSEEMRMAGWKEAIENIQKNVEIVKNIEDSFKTPERNQLVSEENIDMSKLRNMEYVPNVINIEPKKEETMETKHELSLKSAEENMETYATETKETKTNLISDNLKIEKAASLETSANEMALVTDVKNQDTQDHLSTVQGKSTDTLLHTSHEQGITNINRDNINFDLSPVSQLAQNLEKEFKNADERSTAVENKEENTLVQTNFAQLKQIDEVEKTNQAIDGMQAKSVLGTLENNLSKYDNEMKDLEMSETKKSDTLLNEKTKSAVISEVQKENLIDITQKSDDTKSGLLVEREHEPLLRATNENIEGTPVQANLLKDDHIQIDHNMMREALKEEDKQLNIETIPETEHESTKLREVEENDDKIIVSDIHELRNVDNEPSDSEKLSVDDKQRSEDKKAKSVINNEAKVHDIVHKDLTLREKAVETEKEKQHHIEELKDSKIQHQAEKNHHHNDKHELNKERNSVDGIVTKRVNGDSSELLTHLPQAITVGSEVIPDLTHMPSMKMSEIDYLNSLNSQQSMQSLQDKNIDFHVSSHKQDSLSNWNHGMEKYHGIHMPYMNRWPTDRFRSESHLDSNPGAQVHMHHHHLDNIHLEDEPHRFLPMGRFFNNMNMENQHELMNNPMMKETIQENGRMAPEWENEWAMQPNMNMREAVDKNGMSWSHRHAGFGSSLPIVGPASSGSGAVGLFPSASGGCGIPLLLSCSPSVVSGSLAKSHSLRYGEPAYRAGDDMRFYTKRDAKTHDKPTTNTKRTLLNQA